MNSVTTVDRTAAAVIGLVLCALLAAPQGAAARIIAVPDNAATIKAAMFKAQAGDRILVACGTYREHDIQVKPGVSVWSGTLQPDCVIIDPEGNGRAFVFIDADSNTTLVGFTIRNGRRLGSGEDGYGGAVLCVASSPKITNCVLQDNAAGRGGALYADARSLPRVINCLLMGNQATQGGAVFWQGRGGTIEDCSFRGNHALLGGAIYGASADGLRVTTSHFLGNEAGNAGGGAYLADADVEFTGCVLAGNWGGLGGGALATTGRPPRLVNCTLVDNDVEFDGAALASSDGGPSLQHCIVALHRRSLLRSAGEPPSFDTCNLYGNTAGDWTGILAAQARQRGNFSSDPRFCAPAAGDYHLDGASTCLPGNRSRDDGKLVGALGKGCNGTQSSALGHDASAGHFQALRAGL